MARYFDIGQLRTLLQIGRTGSFSAAAKELCKTQPAITHQMQQLAATVGAPLFERSGRHSLMTEEGTRLLHYAKQILALNDEAFRVLGNAEALRIMRIGAPHDTADTLLPAILKFITQKYPLVRVEATVGRMSKLLESLKLGDIDLCVSSRRSPEYGATVIRTSPCVWMCSSDFSFNRSQPLPLVLMDGMSFYREVAQAELNRHNVRWSVAHIAPDLVGAKAAVRAGLGVMPRCIDVLTSGMRVLGAEEGLPGMPDVSFYLLIGGQNTASFARTVYDSLRTQWHVPHDAATNA